jgi:prepilin-type N-terminal cleavage/methylation domain-containing protein
MLRVRGARGFTLVEVLVAITLGLLVVGVGFTVYKKAQDSTTYMTQRQSVQANARAGINQLTQDLNAAGYGMPIGGITVPSAATFSCSTTPGGSFSSNYQYAYSCPSTAFVFPQIPSGNSFITGIMPGYQAGATINGNRTDQVLIAYVDSSPNFYKDSATGSGCTTLGFDAKPLTQATVSGNTTTLYFDSVCPAIDDAKWGFKPGDLVLVSNGNGQAIGEVTAVSSTNVVLAGADAMQLNQGFGTVGSVPNVLGFGSGSKSYPGTLPVTTAYRFYIVGYYVSTDPLAQASGSNADGTAITSNRLYRLVNGDTSHNMPVPVAEQITNLTFNYNMFNSVCGTGFPATASPTVNQYSLIKTINATVWAASTLVTTAVPGQRIQQAPLSTSVSPRNLSYFDSYSSTPQGSC